MLPTRQNVIPKSGGGGGGGQCLDQPLLPELPPRGKHGNQVKSVQSSHPPSIFGFLLSPNPAAQPLEFAFAPATHGS